MQRRAGTPISRAMCSTRIRFTTTGASTTSGLTNSGPTVHARTSAGTTMSDTLPTATRSADPGIRALYTRESRWQAWLDVEVALAKAQAELDIVPTAAAEAI